MGERMGEVGRTVDVAGRRMAAEMADCCPTAPGNCPAPVWASYGTAVHDSDDRRMEMPMHDLKSSPDD